MIFLALAVAAFIAIHLIPAVPAAKQALQARLGKAYGPGFGLASLAGLGLVILAWANRDILPVYEPPAWGRHATYGLVTVAFLFLGIWLFRGSWRQKLRFPFAIAAMAWAAGHLFVRGDLASLILFGGLGLYGAAHFALASANGIRPSPEIRAGHNLLSVVFGLAALSLMVQLHGHLIGVPVISLSR